MKSEENLKEFKVILIDFGTSIGMLILAKATLTTIIVLIGLKIINTINTINLLK